MEITTSDYVPPKIVDFGRIEERTEEDNKRDGLGRGKDWALEADNSTPQY